MPISSAQMSILARSNHISRALPNTDSNCRANMAIAMLKGRTGENVSTQRIPNIQADRLCNLKSCPVNSIHLLLPGSSNVVDKAKALVHFSVRRMRKGTAQRVPACLPLLAHTNVGGPLPGQAQDLPLR